MRKHNAIETKLTQTKQQHEQQQTNKQTHMCTHARPHTHKRGSSGQTTVVQPLTLIATKWFTTSILCTEPHHHVSTSAWDPAPPHDECNINHPWQTEKISSTHFSPFDEFKELQVSLIYFELYRTLHCVSTIWRNHINHNNTNPPPFFTRSLHFFTPPIHFLKNI